MYLFTAIGLLPGGGGYFTCKQNMKLVTTRFKSGGLHEKHVVATWNFGNHLSIIIIADSKTFFSSKFPWTRERISSKCIDNLGRRPQNGSPSLV